MQRDRTIRMKQLTSVCASAVERDLATLRPGHTFDMHIPTSDEEIEAALSTGSYNLHYRITFDDDVQWMLRVRKDLRKVRTETTSLEYCWADVEREVAALQVMYDSGIETVSNAYLPIARKAVIPEYPTAHFYCDFMPGSACRARGGALDEGLINERQARLYLEGYASHQISLSNIKFDQIGQLLKGPDGKVTIVPMFNYSNRLQQSSGPFSTYKDYIIDLWTQEISLRLKYHPKDLIPYLVYLDRKRIIQGCKDFEGSPGQFFLKHADDKSDQYFALDGQLSAVLDWQGAYTTSKEEAFMSPSAIWPAGPSENESSDYPRALSKEEQLLCTIFEEKGRPDLAECVRQTPRYELLHQYFGSSIKWMRRFRRAFGHDQEGVTMPETKVEWVEECLELYKDDPGLAQFDLETRTNCLQPSMPPMPMLRPPGPLPPMPARRPLAPERPMP